MEAVKSCYADDFCNCRDLPVITRLILLWSLLLLLSACAGPLVQPPAERDQGEREPQATEEDIESAPERGSSAVSSLILAARSDYQAGDYSGAIASSERALRIDRREPELYLILAQSYLALARPSQAEQFARQGLRHSGSDTWVSQALQSLLGGL